MSEDLAVRPSPPLVATMRRRLRDPSIVPQFEASRTNSFGGLICPHWLLHRVNNGDKHENDKGVVMNQNNTTGTINPLPGESTGINSIPQRNYIDLRMQQNKLFADERYQHYSKLLSDWKESRDAGVHGAKANEKRNKQWKKLKSCVDEGLAAYPNHEGLSNARNEMEHLTYSRRDAELPPLFEHTRQQSKPDDDTATGTLSPSNLKLKHSRKGAEGRAQMAMRDALLERNFLTAGVAFGGGSGKYDLIPEVDEMLLNKSDNDLSSHNRQMLDDSHRPRRQQKKENKNDDDSSTRSYRRRRKEKKRRRDKHKKKHKRKHDHKSR